MRGIRSAIVLGVLGLAAVAPATAGASNGNYVAMGDSYTAGPGVLPASPTAPADCGQSERNYPHLTAAALNLTLTDVSCGGAKTENFEVAQYEDQPPQFDALSDSTEVITVGMGGNDGNLFGTLVQDCTEIDYFAANKGSPCKKAEHEFVSQTFEEERPAQEAALVRMHELAPNAKIFIVGYPEITPVDGYCKEGIPWTTGDLRWFHSGVQGLGNKLERQEAKAHGAVFVNTFKPSNGHNACEAVGTRWIEPIFGSLTGVALHPNALGEENDAFDVERAMLSNGVR